MTPAIELLKKTGVDHDVHPYDHDASSRSYGLEAAEKLGLPPARVFKTLVVSCERQGLCVAVIPVSRQLDLKRMAAACGAKKASMADAAAAQRATGYVLGGISPLGQKRRLPLVVDGAAHEFATVYVSAGKRGLDLSLSPADLVRLTCATVADICA